MSAQARAALAPEALAALAGLRQAAARLGNDRDAVLELARARKAITAICEQQQAHDYLIAEAVAVAARADGGAGSLYFARQAMARGIEIGRQMAGAEAHPRTSRPAPHRDRHGLWIVQGGAR